MAKGANQKRKLLYLLKILNERTDEEHGLTTEQLIEALAEYGVDAERKTLYADLEELRLFGVDIEMRRGKGATYHVVSRAFELPELKLLVDAVQSSKFVTHRKSGELIKKLESLTSRHEAQQLQRQVFVANRIKTMNESIYYTVDAIQDAIHRNEKISFRYFGWTAKKEKKLHHGGAPICVSPWAMIWDDENYYMVAYEDETQQIKHYRVDKMLNVSPCGVARDGAELFSNFDPALYAKKTFGMFGGREETVTLRCANDLAGVMIDRFGQDVTFVPDGEEHFTLRIRAEVSPIFLGWLMSFGEKLTVREPESLRRDVVAAARTVLAQYGE